MGGHGSIYLLYTDRNSSSFKQHMVKFLDRSKHVEELCSWILHSYICDSINWSGMSRLKSQHIIGSRYLLLHTCMLDRSFDRSYPVLFF